MRDGLAIAAVSLVSYLLLRQEVFYGDGELLLSWLAEGHVEHQRHLLYLPIVEVFRRLLAIFGQDLFEAASVVSATGTAIGVFFTHRVAAQLGHTRRSSVVFAVACASLPSIVFYATVVEIHGPFFAFAGLAFWAGVRLAVRPGFHRGAILGVCTGLAASMHASGHLLPLTTVLFALAQRAQSVPFKQASKALLPAIASLGIVHVAGTMLAAHLSYAGSTGRLLSGIMYFMGPPWQQSLTDYLGVFRDEWILPFLPLSIVTVAGWWDRRLRIHMSFLTALLLLYVVIAAIVLRGACEHGAYLVPFVVPTTQIAILAFGARVVGIAAIVGAQLAVSFVVRHENAEPQYPSSAAVAEATHGGRDVVLFLAPIHLRPLLRHLPAMRKVHLAPMFSTSLDELAVWQLFDHSIKELRANGGGVFMMAGCLEAMRNVPDPKWQRFVGEHLTVAYRVREQSMAGHRLLFLEPIESR